MLCSLFAATVIVAQLAAKPPAERRERPRQNRSYSELRYQRVPVSYAAAVDAKGKAIHSGKLVEVTAVANTGSDTFYDDKTKIYIQDAGHGIAVFGRKIPTAVVPGDLVRVRGRVKGYGGISEIVLHEIERLRSGKPPAPIEVSPNDLLSHRYSGRLVRVRARVVDRYVRANSADVVLNAGDERLYAHFSSHQKDRFRFDDLRAGAEVEITGVASSFERLEGEVRWQVLPRTAADVVITDPPPLLSRRELRSLLYIAATLLAIAIAWLALMRHQVRRKTREYKEVADRLRLLGHTLESAHDLITVTDLQERLTFVNSAFLRTYGYTREQILGQHVSILDSPLNPAELRAEISRSASTTGWRGELFNRRADGSDFPIALTTSVVHDDSGDPVGLVGVARDITAERRISEQLLASEARYRLLFERSPLPTWLYDAESREIVAVNEAAVQKYGFTREAMLEMTIDDLSAGDASPVGVPHRNSAERLEIGRHKLQSGQEIYVELTEHTLTLDGRALRLLVANDVTERRLAQEQIEYQAFHDGLTTLPNRRLFHDRLSVQTALATRGTSSPVVMFVDLDRFKRINDTLGHWAGDELLKQVAARLRSAVRHSDTIARIGGDEFAILLSQEERPSREVVIALANKLLAEFTRPFIIDGRELWVTASIGVATYPQDGTDADTLLKRADFAMYRAKDSGRNNFQLAGGAADSAEAFERLLLEDELHHALGRDELRLYYQPQIDVATGDIVGAEALLRWQHPTRGLLLPRDFLPIAEETPLIVAIGDWVIDKACEQLRQWQDAGLQLTIAVNLSARQFERERVTTLLANTIDRLGIDSRLLELEITERVAMQDVERTSDLLRRVKELGIRIAIDDFGTGYSSLGYLKYFPIDTVKIDQTFVRDINIDPSDAAIVSAVIAMAHTLKLRVVAEGVESTAQLDFLREHKCDAFQGFLVSPAVTAEEFADAIARRTASR